MYLTLEDEGACAAPKLEHVSHPQAVVGLRETPVFVMKTPCSKTGKNKKFQYVKNNKHSVKYS